jgi:hypothetical protein
VEKLKHRGMSRSDIGESAVKEVRRSSQDLIADLWGSNVGIRHMDIVVVGGVQVQYKREIIMLKANVAIFGKH